jgi:hypothetical protein
VVARCGISGGKVQTEMACGKPCHKIGGSTDTTEGFHDMDIWSAIAERDGREAGDFEVLRVAPAMIGSRAPILVIVHPGDAIERFWRDLGVDVLVQSRGCQDRMGSEAMRLMAGRWDAVVLHRGSCSQFSTHRGTRPVADALAEALDAAHRRGTILYGDDLETAVQWMVANLALEQRPEIRLTGAYAEPENGCVAAVGRGIQDALADNGSVRLTVSDASYAGPGETGIWKPSANRGLPGLAAF